MMAYNKLCNRWLNAAYFYRVSGQLLLVLIPIAIILLMTASVWSLYWAPSDRYQHDTSRIMYVHVPAAILAQSAFWWMAIASLVFLIWRVKLADLAAQVIAPFGALMTFLALMTGSIWGIPTWGTWWVWDARLTSMLILLFIYWAIIALRQAFSQPQSGACAAAILTLIGLINLPIIKYSVVWWNTLHQPATFSLSKAPSMPASMWLPLLIMVLGFYTGFIAWILARMRTLILLQNWRARWVQTLVGV